MPTTPPSGSSNLGGAGTSPSPSPITTVDEVVRGELDARLGHLEAAFDADVIAIIGALTHGVDTKLNDVVGRLDGNRSRVVIILQTGGGVVEVVERMGEILRHHYAEVLFVVPDMALSAGTVFAMSGDAILMDYFSRLGPIDPQIEKDGKLIPALGYLTQYQALIKRAEAGVITEAEVALLARFDYAELELYRQARELSVTLLKRWLKTYKFKNWRTTEGRGLAVTDQMREDRAREIGERLSEPERWHSHGRGISMRTLVEELNLRIDDFDVNPDLARAIRSYYQLLSDFLTLRRGGLLNFMHTRNYF